MFSFVPSRSAGFSYLIPPLLRGVEHYILDTLPLPEHIRAPAAVWPEASDIPGRRVYFHGPKLHLPASNDQFICEVGPSPGVVPAALGPGGRQ